MMDFSKIGTHMRNHVQRMLTCLLGSAGLLLVAGCAGSGAIPQDPEGNAEVSFRADVHFVGKLLPLVAGVERGIFEEHGINVHLNEGTGSATTVQTVANGSDQIGFADAGVLALSRDKGIDAKMFYALNQQSPLAVITTSDSGIGTPEQLAGRTGAYTAGSAAEQLFPAFLDSHGLTEEDVSLKTVDIPTRTQIFLAGETDFTFGLTNVSIPQLEDKCPECDFQAFRYADSGVETLGSGFIASDSIIDENPEVLNEFSLAMDESIVWTNDNLDEATKLFEQALPESRESPEVIARQWEATSELMDAPAPSGAFGCASNEQWEQTLTTLAEFTDMGELQVEDVSAQKVRNDSCQ